MAAFRSAVSSQSARSPVAGSKPVSRGTFNGTPPEVLSGQRITPLQTTALACR
ncbi:MAG: hypothetical protein RLZZ232_264 [Planctomycetota bacterium]|jgi:hypothetical protein